MPPIKIKVYMELPDKQSLLHASLKPGQLLVKDLNYVKGDLVWMPALLV